MFHFCFYFSVISFNLFQIPGYARYGIATTAKKKKKKKKKEKEKYINIKW